MSKRFSANCRKTGAIRLCFSLFFLLPVSVPAFAQVPWTDTRIALDGPGNFVYPGAMVSFTIDLQRMAPGAAFKDFDFLLTYDPDVLTLAGAVPGSLLSGCGWEYFDYQSLGISPGVVGIRLTAEADRSEIPGAPSCFLEGTQGTLVNLQFVASQGNLGDCQSYFVRFYWNACDDNRLSSATGDSVYIAYSTCDHYQDTCAVAGQSGLPTFYGTPDVCAAGLIEGRHPVRSLTFFSDFFNGVCADSVDKVGDLNLNGIAYEVADYVLYTNYFFSGLSAFDPNVVYRQAQIAASDANWDGRPLTFQDLVYVHRVIIGDATPAPGNTPGGPGPGVVVTQNDSARFVSMSYPGDLAGAWIVFDGEITPTFYVPRTTPSSNLVMTSGGKTRILSSPELRGSHPSGIWFTYTGNGTIDSVETGDWDDHMIQTSIQVTHIEGACGDINADGRRNISDAVFLVNYIFAAGAPPFDVAGGDVNCSGTTNISDAVSLVRYIFAGGSAPCSGCP